MMTMSIMPAIGEQTVTDIERRFLLYGYYIHSLTSSYTPPPHVLGAGGADRLCTPPVRTLRPHQCHDPMCWASDSSAGSRDPKV